MTATTIPAALDALVARFTAALPGVVVSDGPLAQLPTNPDVLTVGYDEDEDTRSVDADTATAGLASDRETYDVACVASSWTGDVDAVKAMRDRAAAMFATARETLRADPTLGGVVSRSRITVTTLDQAKSPDGCGVSLRFGVHIDAFVP